MAGNAEAHRHVGEGQANRRPVFRLGQPPAQHHARGQILHAHHHRAANGTILEAAEHVELVTVRIDRLHGGETGAIPALVREHARHRVAAIAGQLGHWPRQLFETPLQGFRSRDRAPAVLGRSLQHAPVAGGKARPFGPQPVGGEAVPGARIAIGRAGAALMLRRQRREPVRSRLAIDQPRPPPQRRGRNLGPPRHQRHRVAGLHATGLELGDLFHDAQPPPRFALGLFRQRLERRPGRLAGGVGCRGRHHRPGRAYHQLGLRFRRQQVGVVFPAALAFPGKRAQAPVLPLDQP